MTSGGTARKETVCFDSGTSDGCHAGMIEVASSEPPGPDGAPLLAESAVPCGQGVMVWAARTGGASSTATGSATGGAVACQSDAAIASAGAVACAPPARSGSAANDCASGTASGTASNGSTSGTSTTASESNSDSTARGSATAM